MSTSNLKRTASITLIIAVVSLAIATVIGIATGTLHSLETRYYSLQYTKNAEQIEEAIRNGAVQAVYHINEKKSMPITNINLITVKTVAETIRIKDGSGKSVTAWLAGTVTGDKPHLTVSQHNGVIEIRVERNNSANIMSYSNTLILDINLPQQYKEKLSAESISGIIDLANHDYSGVDLRTTSGNTNIGNMNTPEFKYQSVSGNLYAHALLAKSAEMSSTSGEIIVNAFTGDINVHSVSGIAGITYITVPGNCTAETTSGNIVLNLPQFAKFQLDASSTSGDVMSDFPITTENPHSDSGNHSIVGTVSNGKSQIRLRSISGGIGVMKAGDG